MGWRDVVIWVSWGGVGLFGRLLVGCWGGVSDGIFSFVLHVCCALDERWEVFCLVSGC